MKLYTPNPKRLEQLAERAEAWDRDYDAHVPEHKRRGRKQIPVVTDRGERFDSIEQAALMTGIKWTSNISRAIATRTRTAGRYWQRGNEFRHEAQEEGVK